MGIDIAIVVFYLVVMLIFGFLGKSKDQEQ